MMRLCDFEAGLAQPLFLIAGPDTLESEQLALEVAGQLQTVTRELAIPYIFKGSFYKANRSSHQSYRGPGLEHGMRIMAEVKRQIGVPVLTDVHEDTPLDDVASVVDVLQTPALLCRQTNFMQSVAALGKPVNIKKGQFMAPGDMGNVVAKMEAAGNRQLLLCERGYSFGYNNLVSDMRGLSIMARSGYPVVFDATHSVQLPSAQGLRSGGEREYIPLLARAAVGAGVSGVFMETHPDPDKALCDGPNSWPLALMRPLLQALKAIDSAVKSVGLIEDRL